MHFLKNPLSLPLSLLLVAIVATVLAIIYKDHPFFNDEKYPTTLFNWLPPSYRWSILIVLIVILYLLFGYLFYYYSPIYKKASFPDGGLRSDEELDELRNSELNELQRRGDYARQRRRGSSGSVNYGPLPLQEQSRRGPQEELETLMRQGRSGQERGQNGPLQGPPMAPVHTRNYGEGPRQADPNRRINIEEECNRLYQMRAEYGPEYLNDVENQILNDVCRN